MSDGVFGTLSDDELICSLRLSGDAAVQGVMDAITAKQMKNQDNSTLLLIEVLG